MPSLALALITVLVIWYLYFRHQNCRQARKSLNWLKEIVQGHGSLLALRRTRACVFQADLAVSSSLFRRAEVRLQLQPRHSPLLWLWSRWKKTPEILQFEADLHFRPEIELEVHNYRWRGGAQPRRGRELLAEFQHVGPFVLTTRTDWEREVTGMLTALVASRDCNFLWVRFSRSSPHFVAAIPLNALSPDCSSASEFFVVLQELASCGSAIKF
jgi:hypothetical protein